MVVSVIQSPTLIGGEVELNMHLNPHEEIVVLTNSNVILALNTLAVKLMGHGIGQTIANEFKSSNQANV